MRTVYYTVGDRKFVSYQKALEFNKENRNLELVTHLELVPGPTPKISEKRMAWYNKLIGKATN